MRCIHTTTSLCSVDVALFGVSVCAKARVQARASVLRLLDDNPACTERSPAAQQRTEAAANEGGRGGRQRSRLEEHSCGLPSSDRSIACFSRVHFVPQRLVRQTRATQPFDVRAYLR